MSNTAATVKPKFGKWVDNRQNIIKLHEEPAEWEVCIDLDIPHHKQDSPEVQGLMRAMADTMRRTILESPFFIREADRLGVKLVGTRIDD